MAKIRLLIFLSTITIVGFLAYFAALYARGYRINWNDFTFLPSGLLVVKSDPDGAQILIDDEIKGASNSNFSLAPGTYQVVLKKEGYRPWNKTLLIEKEIVTEIAATLFKQAPSLSAVTFAGASSPVVSSDNTKIAYSVVATSENIAADREGLWLLETVNLPIGFSREPKRVTDGDLTGYTWTFSPDGRQLILASTNAKYLLDTGSFTAQASRTNITTTAESLQNTWRLEEEKKLISKTRSLPPELAKILLENAAGVVFSPDESKILYTLTSEAKLPDELIKPFPGASTQPQKRDLKNGLTYIYDIREDRNFLITQAAAGSREKLSWFPTSRHLLVAQENSVAVIDYDGTNRQEVYSGSYRAPYAFPIAVTDRILILTNLGSEEGEANLYSVTIK